MSCIDFFDGFTHEHNFLMPTVNTENVSMLQRAILRSSASDSRRQYLTYADWSYVHNELITATSRRGLLDGLEAADVRLRRLLSTIANSQFRYQRNTIFERMGRTYALLDVIPTQYHTKLALHQKDRFINLPTVIPEIIGLTVREFLYIGFACFALLNSRFDTHFLVTDELRSYTQPRTGSAVTRHAEIIKSYLNHPEQYQGWLTFQPTDLLVPEFDFITLEKVERYLLLFARTTRELRDITNTRPEYLRGNIPDRLHPLERFPIVQLANNQYIIPNMRHFVLSMTEGLHYLIQEAYPDDRYNQLRGYIQELYLQLLIKDRLPQTTIIPEVSYRKSGQRLDGPDLAVVDGVDNSDDAVLIAIESKAKRMRVATRVAPGSDALINDLDRAFQALQKLPSKVTDLYAGLPEYRSYQPRIDTTRHRTPIALVVVGEGVSFMPELINDHVQQTPGHFLQSYRFPYGIMALETFEQAIELAATSSTPLYELLQTYALNSQRSDFHQLPAEAFDGQASQSHERFVLNYMTLLFDGISRLPWVEQSER